MKKAFTFLLIAALIFTGTVFPLAETEGPPYPSMVELVKQLKADEHVKEIWIPLLPEDYIITELNIAQDGSYLFRYKLYKLQDTLNSNRHVEVQWIGFVTQNNAITRYSPYQTLQVQKENPTPLQITKDTVEAIQITDRIYRLEGNIQVSYYPVGEPSWVWYKAYGTYRQWPAAILNWVDASHLVSVSDKMVSEVEEFAVGLSDTMLASAQCYRFNGPELPIRDSSKAVPWLEKYFGLGFTTIGDANADGTVNAIDALAILKHSVGTASITDELTFLLCDADENNRLDAEDALFALKRAVGK